MAGTSKHVGLRENRNVREAEVRCPRCGGQLLLMYDAGAGAAVMCLEHGDEFMLRGDGTWTEL